MIDLRLPAVLVVLASPVLAETRVTERVSYGKATNFFDPLSNNLIAYKTETKYDEFEQPDDDRLKLASMHCFGSFTIVRGITTGGGACTMTDVNGDRVLQNWRIDHVELGKGYGTWNIVGGTGAHKGITGRGYYLNEETARSGIVKITTTGTLTWPD